VKQKLKAKECTVGNEEWWKMEGNDARTVPLKQYDLKGPKERPIWMRDSGSMYFGEWKQRCPNGVPYFHGFGVLYHHNGTYQGKVYIGEWKDGKAHGSGKLFWLESASSWKENDLLAHLL
jgi:hypothetical protein